MVYPWLMVTNPTLMHRYTFHLPTPAPWRRACSSWKKTAGKSNAISMDSTGYSTNTRGNPESVKHRMRALLAEILDKLESISLELGLRKQVVELDKLIESRLSRIWVTLHESKSRGLRGYGAVSSIAFRRAAAAWRWKFASCCTKSAASLSRRSRTPAPRKRRESRPSRRLAHGLTDWNSRYASCSAELVSMVWKETQGHERRCHPEPFAVTLSEAKGRQLARSE